jgi:hypothetical protein
VANRRQEERERLREAREEREGKQASESRRRLIIGYAAAGLIAAAVIVGIVVAVTSSGGGGGGGAAHIDQSSGSTNGIQPDERQGIAPAALKVSNLKQAAKQAGCVLRLHLRDEGHHRHAALRNQPADLRPARRTALPAGGRRLQ